MILVGYVSLPKPSGFLVIATGIIGCLFHSLPFFDG